MSETSHRFICEINLKIKLTKKQKSIRSAVRRMKEVELIIKAWKRFEFQTGFEVE